MKVGIIGMGWLGQAQKRWLGDHVHVTYDPEYDDEYPIGQIAECDFVVMCVPTYSSCTSISELDEAMKAIPFGRPVLLRSTVPPGTTERYPGAVYCPEFITGEGGNWRDPDDVPFLILGGPGEATMNFRRQLAPLFPGGMIYRCSSRVAELAKLTIDLHLLAKITFVNEMSRIAACYGVDWRDVEGVWKRDPRAGYTHTSPLEHGFEDSGELAAVIEAAAMGDYNAEFLMAIEEANERFRQ